MNKTKVIDNVQPWPVTLGILDVSVLDHIVNIVTDVAGKSCF